MYISYIDCLPFGIGCAAKLRPDKAWFEARLKTIFVWRSFAAQPMCGQRPLAGTATSAHSWVKIYFKIFPLLPLHPIPMVTPRGERPSAFRLHQLCALRRYLVGPRRSKSFRITF